MKKIINLLISVSILMCSQTAFASEITTDANVPVAYYGTPVIDGVMDSIYPQEKALYTDKVIVENTTIEDGSRANVWLLWDYEALYVYAKVDEKTLSFEGEHDYLKDSVEVFIDEDNSKSTTVDENDAQYRISCDNKFTVGLSAPTTFEGRCKKNDDGTYSVEFKCRWASILPADNIVIGFDVQVNDGNSAGKRQSCITWNSPTPNNWENTVDYGNVMLKLGDNYKPWDGKGDLNISVNGYKTIFEEAAPIITNDRTIVPMRKIFELLGAEIAWDDETKSAYVIGNNKLMIMTIGSNVVKVNGEEYISDVPVQLVNGRTMVPLRFVSEMMGATVVYDNVQGAIFINDK